MDMDQVRASFAGQKRHGSRERHSKRSLAKRVMLSRATVAKMLKNGELEFSARYGEGPNTSYEFSSERLDSIREAVVEEIIEELVARLRGLGADEHSIVLSALHTLRNQERDVAIEFAAKPTKDDDDDDEHEIRRLIGSGVAGAGGAVLGGRWPGGLTGRVAGAAIGSATGSAIAGSESAGDIAATAAGAGLGYGAHRLVKSAGGYRKVGQTAAGAGSAVLKGRMATAIRKAMLKAAQRGL